MNRTTKVSVAKCDGCGEVNELSTMSERHGGLLVCTECADAKKGKLIVPKLSATEALLLCQRLHKKFDKIDYDRAFLRKEFAAVDRLTLDDLVAGLKKLEERLQWLL